MCITDILRSFIFLTLLLGNSVFAQITGELQLANEYYKSGEFKKAKILYEELLKDKSKTDFIYENYLATLEKLNEYELAEKFVKKNIKKYDKTPKYKIDHYLLLKKQNKITEAQKVMEKYAAQMSEDRTQVFDAFVLLNDRAEYNFIVHLLLKTRAQLKDPTVFAEQLATAYKALGKREAMIAEMILMVKYEAQDQEALKNKLQPLLDNDQDLDILQKLLIGNVQKDQEDEASTQLLIWVLIQRKDFNMALIQARAFDKRKKLGGDAIFQLAKIAFENNDYETVIEASDYIQTMYVGSDISFGISMLSLRSKEEIIKQTFPIDPSKVRGLIESYKQLCQKNAASPYCMEATRKQALLLAFYLHKRDTAIAMLENLVKNNPYDRNAVDRVKLDLGDLYLLKNEHWESVLLYSQVVKTQKENPLGHEAKFKNAKVHYYKGEFELAQEQLDVLKLATSREIANDALYLSLIIHMNKSEDSSQNALNAFAVADLFKFSQDLDSAEITYKKLLEAYPNDALVDDALWNLSEIAIKKKQYELALQYLNNILDTYHADIFADDALFSKASLYETKLKDVSKAMDLYQDLLTKYPSSIFGAEARRKYRLLRGDKL